MGQQPSRDRANDHTAAEPPARRNALPTSYIDAEASRRAQRLQRAQEAVRRAEDGRGWAGATGHQKPTTGADVTKVLPGDCLARIFSFIAFTERCATLRRLCTTAEDLCASDTLWVQLCYERGITGAIVETATETDGGQDEPNLYLPTLRGANALPYETPLPVQIAAAAWAAARSCRHIDRAAVERTIVEKLAPAHRAMATRAPGGAASVLRCVECGRAKTQYFCLACGVAGCSRTHGSCMASHCKRQNAAAGDSDNAKHAPCAATISITVPPSSGFCYGCEDRLVRTWSTQHARADGAPDPNAGPMPPELLRLFTQRDLHQSMTHAGLFMRHECPHLTDKRIDFARSLWNVPDARTLLIDSNCAAGKRLEWTVGLGRGRLALRHITWARGAGSCANRSAYLCLHCGALLCGIAAADGADSTGHMHRHALETGHLIVIGLRSLTPYCFGCDRVVGVGGTAHDTRQAAKLRQVFTSAGAIFHHQPNSLLWHLFDRHVRQPSEDVDGDGFA